VVEASDAVNFARPMPNWQPLVEYRRNGVAENTIHGAVSWVTGRQLFYSFGGNVEVYGRSMVKPLMMKVFAKEFATALTTEQQAISVASHNGDTEHVRVARSILLEGEWGLMQTPHDVPLVQFGRQVRRPRRWYHCCSGEHAAILRGCKFERMVARRLRLAAPPVFPGVPRFHTTRPRRRLAREQDREGRLRAADDLDDGD
jgi:L-asparaginase II